MQKSSSVWIDEPNRPSSPPTRSTTWRFMTRQIPDSGIEIASSSAWLTAHGSTNAASCATSS